jgi:hypothetical protein
MVIFLKINKLKQDGYQIVDWLLWKTELVKKTKTKTQEIHLELRRTK